MLPLISTFQELFNDINHVIIIKKFSVTNTMFEVSDGNGFSERFRK